ncbi:hypothetical protein AG1IA_08073 [Rhizoctonia solani AG-1 IA]|uniref:Uncharacterized protein n=1 Tax=Thanatephorus cucumeris (strain AG1-IA) TaxID=983506 RepID=L8WI73_THACA|nr:hypothetical protein AG1IA_08073 [Rhizoctonia solani AG-1 IA]
MRHGRPRLERASGVRVRTAPGPPEELKLDGNVGRFVRYRLPRPHYNPLNLRVRVLHLVRPATTSASKLKSAKATFGCDLRRSHASLVGISWGLSRTISFWPGEEIEGSLSGLSRSSSLS